MVQCIIIYVRCFNIIIKEKLPKIYSKDLVEILFIHPYTKIEFLLDKKIVKTRQTASSYLKELENIGLMQSIKFGRKIFYINIELFNMLKNGLK